MLLAFIHTSGWNVVAKAERVFFAGIRLTCPTHREGKLCVIHWRGEPHCNFSVSLLLRVLLSPWLGDEIPAARAHLVIALQQLDFDLVPTRFDVAGIDRIRQHVIVSGIVCSFMEAL